jgi:hypothetical protein
MAVDCAPMLHRIRLHLLFNVALLSLAGCSGLQKSFGGPFASDKLICRFTTSTVTYTFPTGRTVDSKLPQWSLEIKMYSDQVAIRQIGKFSGKTELLPALVNDDYVQFNWGLSDDSTKDDSYRLFVDRRTNAISMTRFKEFGGGASSSADVSGSCKPFG